MHTNLQVVATVTVTAALAHWGWAFVKTMMNILFGKKQ
jgi:hypothetical protein